MGQIKVIHEHYDRTPWASILAGVLIAGLAVIKFVADKITTATAITFALTAIPLLLIVIFSIIRRNRPALVVCNDRLEVRTPSLYSQKMDEIMYSDIKNLALESGQLLIWSDESSIPMYRNLGANIRNAQETYDILRSAYDRYNQEHNITPAQIENLPKRNKGMMVLTTVLIMVLIVIFMIISR